jgi:hypothetical protein
MSDFHVSILIFHLPYNFMNYMRSGTRDQNEISDKFFIQINNLRKIEENIILNQFQSNSLYHAYSFYVLSLTFNINNLESTKIGRPTISKLSINFFSEEWCYCPRNFLFLLQDVYKRSDTF